MYWKEVYGNYDNSDDDFDDDSFDFYDDEEEDDDEDDEDLDLDYIMYREESGERCPYCGSPVDHHKDFYFEPYPHLVCRNCGEWIAEF